MVMTMKIYKGCPVNGTSIATNKELLSDQIAYFEKYPSKTYTINTTRLGEPVRIASSVSEMMGYNYGYIDYGDSYKYFFAVSSISMITESQVEISYTIDAYETLCNQGNLSINKAYMSKYPTQRGDVHLPSEPYYWAVDHERVAPSSITYLALVSVEDSDGNSKPELYVIKVLNTNGLGYVLDLGWTKFISPVPLHPILPSDIYMACICPFPLNYIDATIWSDITVDHDAGIIIYHNPFAKSLDFTQNIGFREISSTLYDREQIRDMRNNVIWECPVGHTYDVQSATLVSSATACNLNIVLSEGMDVRTITVPCEIVDIYDDTWKDYQSRQRESDKSLRQISYNQQALIGVANAFNGGIQGSMAGSLGGAGGGLGALAGVGAGIIGTVGNYAINRYYDPKLQEQYDRQASRQVDNLLLAGNFTDDMYVHNYAGIVRVFPDSVSYKQFEKESVTYGYSTVLYLDSDPRIHNGVRVTGPMRGSVDITADCPADWIEQIASRFSAGITFV